MAALIHYLCLLSSVALLMLQACTCGLTKDIVKIDGSSTVFVISEAIAEEYNKTAHKNVSIGISGTGGGFKKLCSNRINIIGASRSITSIEKELCQKNSVSFVELPVAYDGIVVAVNNENLWLKEISVSALKRMFEPEAEGSVLKWSDIDSSWPDRKFEIFAPGISSGTYDYFTKAIVGKEHSSRGDITSSEDDNVLVHGIRSTADGIGFFSFAYYQENRASLRALAIINDSKNSKAVPILPTTATIQNGSYAPLSRKVFIYANKNCPLHEKEFLRFYIKNAEKIAQDVGFVALNKDDQKDVLLRIMDI